MGGNECYQRNHSVWIFYEVFVYTGPSGDDVPRDVVRARVDPSVTSIPVQAFYYRTKMIEVELCDGLVEIGSESLQVSKINIPTSLRRIHDRAFWGSL